MASVINRYKYLKQIFQSDFISSLEEGGFLHRLLVEQHPKLEIWRKQTDDCLELAFRYNLVNADFQGKLIKGDWEGWIATMNELKVALLAEKLFGVNCIKWHPQGTKGKVGEFEILLPDSGVKIFFEVKTILPRDMENLEERVYDKLRQCVNKLPFPFALSITLKNAGKSENFGQNDFKNFVTKELSVIKDVDNIKPSPLPDYKDERTGLYLSDIKVYKSKKEHCTIGILNYNIRSGHGSGYIKHSLDKASEKKPDSPFLVILCPSPNYIIDEMDVLNAWLGTEKMIITFDKEGKAISNEMVRSPDGFFKHKGLSAFGIYAEELGKTKVEEKLTVYHNPLANIPIDILIFKKAGIKQLVKKNKTEMIWIEGVSS